MSVKTQQGGERHSLWYAVLIGIGIMAAVDEIIFHQLLQWHHFYDGATPFIGLVSDGVLHAFELLALVAGSVLLVGLARERALVKSAALVGMLFGAGGFQLFDGIINHKILRLHQVRYGVDPLLYDLTWNAVGVALLLLGYCLLRQRRSGEKDVAG